MICARALLAEVVRRKIYAIGRRIASDALAHTVTNLRAAAIEIRGFGRIRRYSTLALVGGARIAVVGKIRVVIYARRTHRAIADDFFAITGLLQYGTGQRFRALISNFAFVVDAAAFFTFRLDDIHTIGGNDACDANPGARANIRISNHTKSTFGNRHILRHAGVALIDGTRVFVVFGVAVIIEGFIHANFAKLYLTIAGNLHRPWCGHAVELRINAGARRGIAIFFGAWLGVVAIDVRRARNLAYIRRTNARFVAFGAR